MVPERVVAMDTVPLTANGKVDRRAVRAAVERADGGAPERTPPRTDVERALALVWGEVLGVADPGVTDDFFAAGGDSLLATRLVSELREALDTAAVSARMLLAAPTIEGLASRMSAAEPVAGRLERAAALLCEVAALSDDEVDAELGADDRAGEGIR
ncbi:MAG: phosphopantetheine-binding protein [Actinomycetota bacterium]|nr:phosphopantetheine-binding protein [Actinomycetota bacterium]